MIKSMIKSLLNPEIITKEHKYTVSIYIREYTLVNGDKFTSKEFAPNDPFWNRYSNLSDSYTGFLIADDGRHFNSEHVLSFKDIFVKNDVKTINI